MKVKCKTCGEDIFEEYRPIESLNCRDKDKKYLSKLQQKPSEDCNTSIYLTCENNHTEKYFCKIEKMIKN